MTDTFTDPALQLIAAMAKDGHTSRRIANALNSCGLPTNRGKGHWHGATVDRMAKANGIVIKYDPGAVRRALLRDQQL